MSDALARPRFLYRAYHRRLRNEIAGRPLPRHIAMILDGNRRWAKRNAHASTSDGYRAGAQRLIEFLGWCDEFHVDVTTLYLLSLDNLGRDSAELDGLCGVIADLATELGDRGNWRIRHVGHAESLPAPLRDALRDVEERTASHTGMVVNLAVGYGGRQEVAEAIRKIVNSHEGTLEALATKITPELIGEHLYTGGQPDPDLVIRTSGEQRLSDFMLWQSAHSEFFFLEALGPDLREVDFLRALRAFGMRQRRYGR